MFKIEIADKTRSDLIYSRYFLCPDEGVDPTRVVTERMKQTSYID